MQNRSFDDGNHPLIFFFLLLKPTVPLFEVFFSFSRSSESRVFVVGNYEAMTLVAQTYYYRSSNVKLSSKLSK